jgi:TRAP-type C4-dicarboxylate transport system permease small subunit
MSDESPVAPQPQPLSTRLGPLGKIDEALYNVEVIIVVAAVVIMSVVVFTDVVYQLVFGLLRGLEKGEGIGRGIALLTLVWMIAFSSARRQKTGPDGQPVEGSEPMALKNRLGIAFGVTAGLTLLSVVLVSPSVSSSLVYQILSGLLGARVVALFWGKGQRVRAGLMGAATLAMVIACGSLPEGYSWSQSYALFLLLWSSFLGASIAARNRSHLGVDLMRKVAGPKRLPAFNAVSFLLAALFSGVIAWLGIEYLFGHNSSYMVPVFEVPTWLPSAWQAMLQEFPLPPDASLFNRVLHVAFAPGEPGELPDWLKVAVIPLSFTLITIRFLGHSIVFGMMAVRGEEFVEQLEVH